MAFMIMSAATQEERIIDALEKDVVTPPPHDGTSADEDETEEDPILDIHDED